MTASHFLKYTICCHLCLLTSIHWVVRAVEWGSGGALQGRQRMSGVSDIFARVGLMAHCPTTAVCEYLYQKLPVYHIHFPFQQQLVNWCLGSNPSGGLFVSHHIEDSIPLLGGLEILDYFKLAFFQEKLLQALNYPFECFICLEFPGVPLDFGCSYDQ